MSGVLAFDTATPATVVGAVGPEGHVALRDDPPEGSRGEHASRLLPLVEQALEEAGLGWEDVRRIGVGVGPGGFTGLRIGVATARSLALARDLPLVAVSSLEALVEGVAPWQQQRPPRRSSGGRGGAVSGPPDIIAAVLDARRGEAYAAVWDGGRRVLAPAALAPEALVAHLRELDGRVLAVGDGAVRFREELEAARVVVPPDDAEVHRIDGGALCRLALVSEPADRDALLPDYRRAPDATPLTDR